MSVKSLCPHCQRTNFFDDATRGSWQACQFCQKSILASENPTSASSNSAVKEPNNSGFTLPVMGQYALGIIVVMLLVQFGFLPVSCAQKLPGVGARFSHLCADCNGKGQVPIVCRSCSGRGFFGGVNCRDCGGSGKLSRPCAFCAGSGRKPGK